MVVDIAFEKYTNKDNPKSLTELNLPYKIMAELREFIERVQFGEFVIKKQDDRIVFVQTIKNMKI